MEGDPPFQGDGEGQVGVVVAVAAGVGQHVSRALVIQDLPLRVWNIPL